MIKPINNQPPLAAVNPRETEPEAVAATPAETGTAVAVVNPAPGGEEALLARRSTSASYLAHLIATRNGLPQTRERRRAEPEEATAAYTAALERIHRFP